MQKNKLSTAFKSDFSLYVNSVQRNKRAEGEYISLLIIHYEDYDDLIEEEKKKEIRRESLANDFFFINKVFLLCVMVAFAKQ